MDRTLRNRLAKLLWQQAARQRNPWFDAAASGLEGYRERWDSWHREQIELLRALCAVVFGDTDATDELLKRAVDFIERVA